MGIVEWSAKVRDAIETNEDGKVDAFLEETLAKPIMFSVAESYVDDVVWVVNLRVEGWTRNFTRGGRTAKQL